MNFFIGCIKREGEKIGHIKGKNLVGPTFWL